MPAQIHVTTPKRFRGQRKGVVVHHEPLAAADRTVRDAVPVTTVERTLADIAQHSDPSLAMQALHDALEQGITNRRRLRRALKATAAGDELLDAIG